MPRGDDAASPPPPAPGSVSVSARETKHPATVNPWRIGQPDQIISLPAPVPIPAHGVIDYVNVEVDPGFTKDVWVRGAEVRPGVVQALHHCTVMIAPGSRAGEKNSHDGPTPEVSFLAGYVPGLTASLMPPGMARRIPAGWHIYFQLHYVSTGVALTDQTSLGLVFSEPAQHAVRTNILHRDDLQLRPYDANQRFEQTWNVPADMLLLAMLPHMHLRGSSFRYEALYPDGRSEVLLSVPKFDMMWQHHYVLAEPKLLPAGAVLRAVATYDNSPANPRNPDPSATVRVGPQSTDEMFNGWFDVAEIEPPRRVLPIAWAAVGVVALWAIDRRRRGKTAA
jgi:hypothetical protein